MISGIQVDISTYEGGKRVFAGTAMAYARAIASGNLKLAGKHLAKLIQLSQYGERNSPFIIEYHASDIAGMDTGGLERLSKAKTAVVEEMLAVADAAGSRWYRKPPVGKPFKTRIGAAEAVLDKFMFVSTRLNRKNAQRALKRRLSGK